VEKLGVKMNNPNNPYQNIYYLITVVGIIATFILGLINILMSLRRTKIENITQNRMTWINSMRTLLAELVAMTDMEIFQRMDNEITNNFISALNIKVAKLKLYLNFDGDFDIRIIQCIDKLQRYIYYLFFRADLVIRHANVNDFQRHVNLNSQRSYLLILHNLSKEYNKIVPSINVNEENASIDELKSAVVDEYCSVNSGHDFWSYFIKDLNCFNKIIYDINLERENLVKLAQIYLKSEWNRVKRESSFNIRKYNEKEELKVLEEKYKRR
jgi:hypothetical protein